MTTDRHWYVLVHPSGRLIGNRTGRAFESAEAAARARDALPSCRVPCLIEPIAPHPAGFECRGGAHRRKR